MQKPALPTNYLLSASYVKAQLCVCGGMLYMVLARPPLLLHLQLLLSATFATSTAAIYSTSLTLRL